MFSIFKFKDISESNMNISDDAFGNVKLKYTSSSWFTSDSNIQIAASANHIDANCAFTLIPFKIHKINKSVHLGIAC